MTTWYNIFEIIMIVEKFISGHPIGSSLDPSGPSGLTHRNRGSEYYNYALDEVNWNSTTGLIHVRLF